MFAPFFRLHSERWVQQIWVNAFALPRTHPSKERTSCRNRTIDENLIKINVHGLKRRTLSRTGSSNATNEEMLPTDRGQSYYYGYIPLLIILHNIILQNTSPDNHAKH